AALASYEATWDEVRKTLFPALTAILVVALFVCFFVALAREPRRAVPYYVGMAACTVLVAVLVMNWGPQLSTREAAARVNAGAMAQADDARNFREARELARDFGKDRGLREDRDAMD